MGIEEFQQDLRDGMKLEKALEKHNLSFRDAVELCPKPFCHRKRSQKPRKKRNVYKQIDKYISQRGEAFYVRKTSGGKNYWGGAYDTIEEATLIRDFLEENGWNVVKVREACKKYNIERRRR